MQHLKNQIDSREGLRWPKAWYEPSHRLQTDAEDEEAALSLEEEEERIKADAESQVEAEPPSAFDVGKSKRLVPPTQEESPYSAFDVGKKNGYTEKPPQGDPGSNVVASWGYSMNAVPHRGRRPSINSDILEEEWSSNFLKEEEHAAGNAWKLHKVEIKGSGARHLKESLREEEEEEEEEELMMGTQVLIEITQGGKVLAVLDEDGIPMTQNTLRYSGGETKIGLPDYYLPEAQFRY